MGMQSFLSSLGFGTESFEGAVEEHLTEKAARETAAGASRAASSTQRQLRAFQNETASVPGGRRPASSEAPASPATPASSQRPSSAAAGRQQQPQPGQTRPASSGPYPPGSIPPPLTTMSAVQMALNRANGTEAPLSPEDAAELSQCPPAKVRAVLAERGE